jgi:hypothetical protein
MGRNCRSLTTVKLSLLAVLSVGVCLADSPFSDAAQNAAIAKTVQGDVSVLRDFRLLALVAGDRVKVKETIVTGLDGHALFAVADGSTFEVFPNSRVVFRKNPPSWEQLLDILLGKVRVKIEHLGDKPNNNKIYTPPAVIAVRGTTFEITVDSEEVTTVEVVEGVVEVRHLLVPTGRTAELRQGDVLRVYPNVPIARGSPAPGLMQKLARAAMDAIVVAMQPRSVGTIGGGPAGPGPGNGGGVGDTGGGSGPPTNGPGLPPPSGPGAPPPPPGTP